RSEGGAGPGGEEHGMSPSPFQCLTRLLSALAIGTFVALAPWAATAAHAAVTSATFSGSTLTVTVDGGDDDIALRHDEAGRIQVLDHTAPVAITGGPATLTNTDTINITTGDGDDRVTVDE